MGVWLFQTTTKLMNNFTQLVRRAGSLERKVVKESQKSTYIVLLTVSRYWGIHPDTSKPAEEALLFLFIARLLNLMNIQNFS